MEFALPVETGEQLAFGAAAFTVLLGLMMLFAPGFSLRILGFALPDGSTAPYSETRSSLGGFYAGLGLAAILVAQPFVYFALGTAYGLAAFARIVSILSDRGTTVRNYIFLVVQIVLSGIALGYFFGII
ncbi:AGROH133_08824 family phage infection protein [Gellertiella hungarica]|uniref:DUF4345 domain-containing protein n=1 Tax=Gellertiella hungarica TaxID=1572859 RepID=A0A7W6J7A4_9HYPH|nr:DUF4345 domain-containing protein [Gellertiella hungarica]MBB4065208.1 hypothetical protein [Gellertiella hungarica]